MKTRVWTLPTRLFHWMLAVGFVTAYILGEEEELGNLHYAFGAMVGGLAILRLLFGLVGPRYSHFSDFRIGFKRQMQFLKNFLKPDTYPGHNPPAALIMLAIMLIAVLTAMTGYLTYSGEAALPLAGLSHDQVKEIHETLAGIFLGLVIVHLVGILIDTLVHRKTGTLLSMFSGDKNNVDGPSVRLNAFQVAFSFLWILVPLVLFVLAYRLPPAQEGQSEKEHTEQHSYSEDDD